ncbi:SusC/RagA family TonB-linked outer membrane protein [Tenacibaculum sp. KUL118]|nr:SusC/RagA family TonB-linked outer membrane protein [Tenacibaculum sp. KUL118]
MNFDSINSNNYIMKTKINGILTLLLALVVQISFAQEKVISGTVSDETGPLPGVNVLIKGTTSGVETDFDGKFSIKAKTGDTLIFSFVGMKTVEKIVGTTNVINLTMASDNVLDEVVVTSLGIKRAKKSLGYASQEIKGDKVSTVKLDNVVNSLSGKISGVQIKANNNFGGSSNFLIRGISSLTGNNQPLFIIDGIPISNQIENSANQKNGRRGFDYGNAASDINPDDVESINILKGAAASAIYGSRGANGVVIITTKKGKEGNMKVNISSGITLGKIDRSTFLKYQDKYGAGYGPYYGSTGYFEDIDVNGDGINDLAVPTYEDGSFGAPLDGSLVYQWDAFVPEHPNYQTATPYIAGKNTPADFFETSHQINNSISISGSDDKVSYRLGYTNFQNKGILPNSKLDKNTFNFNGTLKVSNKLTTGANANFINQDVIGRNSTGYGDNLMSQFRQWWQVNVDIKDQKYIYDLTGKNYSWNHQGSVGGSPLQPQYWDNPYWTRYQNYQSDNRNRFFGNAFATYNINDWLDLTGKVAVDTYSEVREDRRAVGSVATEFGLTVGDQASGYQRTQINFSEFNYDLMLNFSKDLFEKLTLNGVLGMNIRKEKYHFWRASTNGGLANPGVYSLRNSVLPVNLPEERLAEKQVNGYYVQATLGYNDRLFLEFTDRYDVSSSLPTANNSYNYFAVSGSFIFSELINTNWLNYGKLRAGYAEVGNDLPANNVYDTYNVIDHFGSVALSSFNGTKKNENLVPERTKEIELGLETRFLNNRLGLNLSWYKKDTENQLMPVTTTAASGFSSRWVNAGTIENKGVEVSLDGKIIQNEDFKWNTTINWSKNNNLVKELYSDVENIQLASFQGGISINATKGQPYGTIRGTGFVYDDNGNKVVNDNGYYKVKSNQIIGDTNPDWNAGITNTLSYKNLSLSFLIDIQQGGDVYSLDLHYGQGTGLPDYTGGLNELGNPIRNPITSGPDSGGVLNPGVTEDGQPNTTRTPADTYNGAFYWGDSNVNPAALTIYDASYIKLRELSLKYNFPKTWLQNSAVSDLTISLVGRNLWIIDKNVPFADPESGLGAGNAQGYLSGSYPTVRTVGLNVNLEF